MLLALLPLLTMSQATPYDEPLRPQFHFTAKSGWLNDPNGLAYFKGEYHLFFQHNPFGTQWGNMTWGHAVSKDLVHWRQLDNALSPDELGTMFSGSAVVAEFAQSDISIATGPGSDRSARSALVCFYTAAGGTNDASKGRPFTQCLAYSHDGRTFSKYPGNPVIPHIEAENRDPKVIWHGPTKRWVMALYLNESRFALYGSADLVTWSRLSNIELPGASECPDLFPLALDGDKEQTKWVFWGGNGLYLVGDFDGAKFHPETKPITSIFGNTAYAAQTFFNDPKGRRVQIAWHRGSEFPGAAWNQQMGFPTELKLVSTHVGPKLAFAPVEEIRSLRLRRISLAKGIASVESGLFDASLHVRVPSVGRLRVEVTGHPIEYDAATQVLSAVSKSAKVEPVKGALRLRILADRASIEVFAQDGLISMPLFVLPKPNAAPGVRIDMPVGFTMEKSEIWELKSAWQAPKS